MHQPKSDFAQVNGIRLHYLDWGGTGPTLIFLTGMGSSAYIYSQFAAHFSDQFRVVALTRRGHGDSDYPDTGYDADTLTEDIRQFMDQLGIDKACLIGHSLAGVELTQFAATHPSRVEKLVYMDALDDRRQEQAVFSQNPLRNVQIHPEPSPPPRTLAEYIALEKRNSPAFAEIWSEVWDEEYAHGTRVNEEGIVVDRMPASIEKMLVENLIHDYAPKPVAAPIPVLSFYSWRTPTLSNAYTEAQQASFYEFHRKLVEPLRQSLIADFQSRFPQAEIVVIPNGHHYCFMAQAELVYTEMRQFLLR